MRLTSQGVAAFLYFIMITLLRTLAPRGSAERQSTYLLGHPVRRQCRWIRTRSLSKIITRPSPAAIEVATRSFQP